MERLEGVVAGKQVVEAKIRRDAARDAYEALNAQLGGDGGSVAVVAPISGVITKAEIASGEIVDGSRALYTIADLSKVWVEADLFEGALPRVEGAVDAAISTPSYPGATFAGRLHRTGSAVDPSSRTITALFLVDNPGERLKLNMSVSVALATGGSARVLAVPRGQTDAARILGLTEAQVFFLVIFPQALRYIIPALVAQLVIVVKDTTFGYVVTYGELMQNAKVLIANYHALVPVYLVVAALYCLVNYAISRASKRLGRPMH